MTTEPRNSRVTGADRASLTDDLAKEYAAGASIRALAEKTGRSYGFVHRLLSESEVTFRGRGGPTRGPARDGAKKAPTKAKR